MHNAVICCARSTSRGNRALTNLLHRSSRRDFRITAGKSDAPSLLAIAREILFLLDEPPTFARSPTFRFRSHCTRSLPFRITRTCGDTCVLNFSSFALEDRREGKTRAPNYKHRTCERGHNQRASAPEGTGPFINPDTAQDGLCQGARRRLPRVRPSAPALSLSLSLSFSFSTTRRHQERQDIADPPGDDRTMTNLRQPEPDRSG